MKSASILSYLIAAVRSLNPALPRWREIAIDKVLVFVFVKEWVSEWVLKEWDSEWMSEWVFKEWDSEIVSEWVNEWINKETRIPEYVTSTRECLREWTSDIMYVSTNFLPITTSSKTPKSMERWKIQKSYWSIQYILVCSYRTTSISKELFVGQLMETSRISFQIGIINKRSLANIKGHSRDEELMIIWIIIGIHHPIIHSFHSEKKERRGQKIKKERGECHCSHNHNIRPYITSSLP